MIAIAALIAVVCFAGIGLPFFFGSDEPLSPGAAQNSIESLVASKSAIVRRYLKEEASFVDTKEISAREWRARREFLQRRYVDAARRLEYLEKSKEAKLPSGGGA